MTDGEIHVTGPEAGRLSASFNENLELTVSAHDGSEMGAFLQVAENTSAAARAVFGLSETTWSQVLTRPHFFRKRFKFTPQPYVSSRTG
jgi:flagellar hook-associated protein 1 FlgK